MLTLKKMARTTRKITEKGSSGAVQAGEGSDYTHMHLRIRVWKSVLTIRYPWETGGVNYYGFNTFNAPLRPFDTGDMIIYICNIRTQADINFVYTLWYMYTCTQGSSKVVEVGPTLLFTVSMSVTASKQAGTALYTSHRDRN